MDNKTFTGGVVPGGLNDDNQIRILICCIVAKRRNKLTGADIIGVLTEQGLANYFESANAISDLIEKGHLTDDGFSILGITDSGVNIADTLYSDVPASVRDKALAAIDGLLKYRTNIGQHKAVVKPADKGFTVKCSISDLGSPVFSMEIYAPTRESAEHIRKRFVEYGAEIYQDAIETLTK